MIDNSRAPGIASEQLPRARQMQNLTVHDLDAAMRWAADACMPGEYTETLLPALLWGLEKAAVQLDPLERRLRSVRRPAGKQFHWSITYTGER